MNKLKLYKYAILGLVLLNIVVLGFFMMKKGGHHPHKHRGLHPIRAAEMLKLNEGQQNIFLSLAKQHRAKMDSLGRIKKEILSDYFASINQLGKNVTNGLLIEVNQIDREKLEMTYRHFEDIKLILNEDQMAPFKKFIERLTQNMSGFSGHRHGRKK